MSWKIRDKTSEGWKYMSRLFEKTGPSTWEERFPEVFDFPVLHTVTSGSVHTTTTNRSITYADGYYYIGRIFGSIQAYDSQGRYSSSKSIDVGSSNVYSLTFDGTNIWYTLGGQTLYSRNISTGVAGTSFSTSGITPNSVAWNGTHLVVTRNQNARVYTVSGSLVHSQFELWPETPSNNILGTVYVDGKYWGADSSRNKVYVSTVTDSGSAFTATDVPSMAFDLADENTNANGMAWDGRFLRVVDSGSSGHSRVFTYDLEGNWMGSV